MTVYVVVCEAAYGLQIDKIFIDRQKAYRWVNKRNAEDYNYQYDILEFLAE